MFRVLIFPLISLEFLKLKLICKFVKKLFKVLVSQYSLHKKPIYETNKFKNLP